MTYLFFTLRNLLSIIGFGVQVRFGASIFEEIPNELADSYCQFN
jgi:hypothetical protein